MVWFRKHFEKLGLCKYGSAFSKSYQNHNKKVIYGIRKRWPIKKIKEKVRRKDPRTNYRSIHARASSSLPSPSSIPITISSRGGRSSFRSLNCNSRCYTGSRESSSRFILWWGRIDPAVDLAFYIGNAIDDVIEAPLPPSIAVVEPVALDREPDAPVVKA